MQGSIRGFSLVEFLAALLVASVLLSVAVPAYQNYVADSRMSSATNLLVAHLSAARSEAVTRGVPVALCVSGDQKTCSNTTDWESGWIVFTDSDGVQGVRDGTDELLHSAQVQGEGMSLGSADTYVRFGSLGEVDAD